jgi:hypothetical protein
MQVVCASFVCKLSMLNLHNLHENTKNARAKSFVQVSCKFVHAHA